MSLVVKYSKIYPYLPEAVGDNFHDLGRILGISASAVSHAVHRDSESYKVVKTEQDMWPTNNGDLWYYDDNGKMVIVED